MGKKERLGRDHAGIGPEPNRSGLQPLSRTKGFRIAKGEPDIRGWEVHTLNGRPIGEVDDLLVDVDSGDVVMMDVEMRGSERHFELPLRTAQLDRERKRVIVDSGDVQRYGGDTALDDDDLRDRDRDGVPDRLDARERSERDQLERDQLERDQRDRDRLERDQRDRDRDGVPDRLETRDRLDPDRDRDGVPDRLEGDRRPSLDKDRDALERERLARRARTSDDDTEEIVIERRPVVEEVVIRRRVVDKDE